VNVTAIDSSRIRIALDFASENTTITCGGDQDTHIVCLEGSAADVAA